MQDRNLINLPLNIRNELVQLWDSYGESWITLAREMGFRQADIDKIKVSLG